MNSFIHNLLNILRLRTGPQDLPVSWPLTLAVCAIYVGEGILTGQHVGAESGPAKSVTAAGIQFLSVAVLLNFRGVPERLPQTLLAFAGTGFIIGLLVFFFLLQADPERNQPVLALLWIGIFGWSLAVDAHIYRHALSIAMSRGLLVAVVVLAFTYVVMEIAFR